MTTASAYLGLFVVAFGAATILPLQSEAVLVGLLALGRHSAWVLILVATLGNVLGSIANYGLGFWLERMRKRSWFPVSEAGLGRAQRSYHRYGRWSLLLSWVPLIGDPLTIVAGTMREPLWSFTLLVLVAKMGRYLVLASIVLGVKAQP
jgi:membrane protein YqaA with SNARE-associated domain